MFKFKARQTSKETPADTPPKARLLARLRQGLSKTGDHLTEGMAALVMGQKTIDDELFETLETRLLTADVGVEATQEIIDNLTQRVKRRQLTDASALVQTLRQVMTKMLTPYAKPLVLGEARPFVILMVGVNGSGKTTTAAKLALRLKMAGHSVLLAAGDTFRAAAVEQLQVWGEREGIPIIAQGQGADSAAVIFDALQAATARGVDILIADTAGRLHTQTPLMEELNKVKRVLAKLDARAPHEVMLVIDAGTGQNALTQARQFHEALALTGLTLTKLDGTAKGGIVFALTQRLGVPIRFIGIGEAAEDLQVFDAEAFVDALLSPGADTPEM